MVNFSFPLNYSHYVTTVLISSLIIFIYELVGVSALHQQKLSIFPENCCKGKNEFYLSNVRNLMDVSMIANKGLVKSFSIHYGLWALSTGINYTKEGIYYEGANDDSGNCGSSASAGGGEEYIQYKSIRFIGNSWLELPGLSLFTEDGFLGEELYFDGTNFQLTSPFVFKSYGFTGKENWTVYPLANFHGEPFCLIAQNKVVSFVHKNINITVGSIQRGCFDKSKDKKRTKPRRIIQAHHALILHQYSKQNGDNLYTDGFETRLPIPFQFKTYSFYGTRNWTIYSGIDWTGRSLCLVNPKSSSTSGNTGANERSSKKSKILGNISVGSIRRGCETDPIKELIALPSETQDQQGRTGNNGNPINLPTKTFEIIIKMRFINYFLLMFLSSGFF